MKTGTLACLIAFLLASPFWVQAAPSRYEMPRRSITVDGDITDWKGIAPNNVRGADHLWFGQGMEPEMWRDNKDLSYRWRGAWSNGKLYFLFEVTDDKLTRLGAPLSFQCDAIEIYLDMNNQGGRRVKIMDGRKEWSDKYDPREMMGYELHFLPADPVRVYLDHTYKCALDKPQTARFKKQWAGETAFRKTPRGYRMEIGLAYPGVKLTPGKMIGVETGVCDDDGRRRESIMMWTGSKGNFWETMDEYGTVTLSADAPNETASDAKHLILGRLGESAQVAGVAGPDGRWGIRVSGAGTASATQLKPVQLRYRSPSSTSTIEAGYDTLRATSGRLVGRTKIPIVEGAAAEVEDRWTIEEGSVLTVERRLTVRGSASGGFFSQIAFDVDRAPAWNAVGWFAPGMIYGGPRNLSEMAIGGPRQFAQSDYQLWIREDRLPAPMLGARFADGSTLAVLDPRPNGATIAADALDAEATIPLIDERIAFGAVGAEGGPGRMRLGFRLPGTEGSITYRGDTYPGGQMERQRPRYHPLRDGLEQRAMVSFRFGRDDSFPAFYRNAWRWAWRTLKPPVTPNDLGAVRRSVTDVLAAMATTSHGCTGIPHTAQAVTGASRNPEIAMGFCGKNLEAAEFLLKESQLDAGERGRRMHRTAEAIIDTFLRLKAAPPEATGFDLSTGKPNSHLWTQTTGVRNITLREWADDVKALLRAVRRERATGVEHPKWLAWARDYADWLLTQQQPGGGFPRAWEPGTGRVVSASPNSSFNPIPLLVLLTELTGERKYLEAAARAAECVWNNGQSEGRFVGGTIDNPDVIDKEAGTLSLEAYLALHGATGEAKWLERARAAAAYAETWIYLWNVPMAPDAAAAALGWKPGVPTVGIQLISTGHSLTDEYMAYDADEFARLFKLTGDDHNLAVARILLHNTKNMTALPGRTFDLAGPGWQQEHWSMAPRRGQGLHRLWLPWVAASQLNGIIGLMELDPALDEQLAEDKKGE